MTDPSAQEASRQIAAALLGLQDLTPSIVDAMDSLDVGDAVVAGDALPPLSEGRAVGVAVTIRYVPCPTAAPADASAPRGLAHEELLALVRPGTFLVADAGGVTDVAVFGGVSVAAAKQRGAVGIVVDGSVRDVDALTALGLPIWSSGRSPRAATGRLQAAEVNGPVSLHGVRVCVGDIVAADGSGVVVVPSDRAAEIAARATAIEVRGSEAALLRPPTTPAK